MSGGLRLDLPLSEDASNYLVVAALASPHVLYAFIWYFPHIWRKQFGKKGVEVFETCAWLLKGMTICADVVKMIHGRLITMCN